MFSVRAMRIVSFRTPALTQLSSRRALATAAMRAQQAQSAAQSTSSAYEITAAHSVYLQNLLKEDDSEAAWNQQPVEMVSREVQSLSSDHETW
ncbi:hypothetical protein FB645_000647 [Coemansia sp. IMI 203386]|nr:hypothetical protein FB645_000647 [Coemansia sp. IMI 203386]